MTIKRRRGEPLEEFFARVVIRMPNGCWLFPRLSPSTGYGQMTLKLGGGRRATLLMHRWSYEHFRGPIPRGRQIDHLCRNRWCVNPTHLDPVTVR